MGRYYSGDIEGKFWFGVQSSADGTFFGGKHDYIDSEGEVVEDGDDEEACEIYYHFDKEDLKEVHEKIQECLNALGEYHEKLEQFFEEHNGYNDDKLASYLEVSVEKTRQLLEWYARLGLGLKIENCISEKGECNFQAEFY